MKKLFALTAFFILHTLIAQQSTENKIIISPQVNNNKTVTFRIKAPEAKEVKVSGDWIPEGSASSITMTKGPEGLWSYTTLPLNSNLYIYSFSVDGLRTIDPNNVYIIRDVSNLFNMFIIGDGKADLYKVNNVPHGTVTRRWYDSPGNSMKRRLTIYTPPGYETSKEKYPVLYLLHGMGGDEEAWMTLGRTSQIMDNLIAQGKTKPMIVVMPNGNVSQEAAPGESSMQLTPPTFDLPNTMDGRMEQTFPEVIKFTEGNYRVIADKAHRAIAGLSMGGFHSLHISRYYPNQFDYIGLLSPAILPDSNINSAVYDNLDKTLKTQMDNKYKLYWIAIGKNDFLYKTVKEYRERLDKMGMPYKYKESEGGHNWSNWRDYLSEFVPQLFQ